MSTITVYSFENAAGPFGSFTTMDLDEAKEYARKGALKVIANEYEFADSELVEDYTDEACEHLHVKFHGDSSSCTDCGAFVEDDDSYTEKDAQ